ncbi:hypothetical protein M3Y97_00693800 [Aphelenchoides bicaudatus]|nr:hypothetical protein M3Y97_00693800 [Aphelenchoides bicaudatus]
MEVFLFNRDYYNLHYNCSFYQINTIPLELRKHELFGTCFLFAYTMFLFLYVFCLFAMIDMPYINRASNRLMILLACIHIVGLQLGGFLTGAFGIEGAVFCSHPNLIYVAGSFGVANWAGSTSITMILGFNRCCELQGGSLAKYLFGSWRLYIWMALPITYSLYILWFTPPNLFSGIHMSWFFNPHYGYYPTHALYQNNVLIAHNIVVCCTEFTLYGVLVVLYFRASRYFSPTKKNALRKEKRIYVQVILVGAIHFTASSIYMFIQFFPVNFYTVLIESTFYLLSQGFPPVIYLYVNPSLRQYLRSRMKISNCWRCILLSVNKVNSQVGTTTTDPTPTPVLPQSIA